MKSNTDFEKSKVRSNSEYSRMRRGLVLRSWNDYLNEKLVPVIWMQLWQKYNYTFEYNYTFMTKCLKFYVHSKNAIKYWQKVFGS